MIWILTATQLATLVALWLVRRYARATQKQLGTHCIDQLQATTEIHALFRQMTATVRSMQNKTAEARVRDLEAIDQRMRVVENTIGGLLTILESRGIEFPRDAFQIAEEIEGVGTVRDAGGDVVADIEFPAGPGDSMTVKQAREWIDNIREHNARMEFEEVAVPTLLNPDDDDDATAQVSLKFGDAPSFKPEPI